MIKAIALFLLLVLVLVTPLKAQEDVELTATAELNPFTPSENVCFAPCWFGLTAGQSTASDVVKLFSDYSDLFNWFLQPYNSYTFNEKTDYLVDGLYEFYWKRNTIEGALQSPSKILIRDGIVALMTIWANEIVTLGQVLDALGQPDDIIFYQGYTSTGWLDVFVIRLGYFDKRVVISFKSFAGNKENGAMQGVCQISSIENDFQLLGIDYYSPDEMRIAFGMSNGTQSLELPIRSTLVDRRILSDIWYQWLQKSQIYGTCLEGWFSLPEAIPLPTETPES